MKEAVVGALIGALPAYVGLVLVWIKAGGADNRAERAEQRAEEGLDYARRVAEALEAAATGATVAVGRQWVTENPKKGVFVLRHLGPGTATGVAIDDRGFEHVILRGLPRGDVDLAEGEGHQFMAFGTNAGSPPPQIWVRTDEEPEWVAVPLASW